MALILMHNRFDLKDVKKLKEERKGKGLSDFVIKVDNKFDVRNVENEFGDLFDFSVFVHKDDYDDLSYIYFDEDDSVFGVPKGEDDYIKESNHIVIFTIKKRTKK